MERDAKPKPVATPKLKRRWFQYSTRALLGLMAVCGVVLALVVNPAVEQRRAVAFVESVGGKVTYADGGPPEWLQQMLGTDLFRSVEEVELGTKVGDAGLVNLQGLSGLKRLWLDGRQISDAGLLHLKGLTGLELLFMEGAQVSEVGLTELQEALPNCKIFPYAIEGENY